MKRLQSIYFPGIVLFIGALLVSMLTYQDYGVGWDEPLQRDLGLANYEYIFNGNNGLLTQQERHYGAGYELVLVFIEKLFNITDFRDVFLMRHLAGNIFFLIAVLFFYVLIVKLFNSRTLGIMGAIMLIASPRIYAHSFFNCKDLPFLSMVIITLVVCRWAFEKDRAIPYFVLGLACGYTTGIRIMGILLCTLIVILFLIDIFQTRSDRQKLMQKTLGLLLFLVGFCTAVYISWPFLWRAPIHNFMESYGVMSHFGWGGDVYFKGQGIPAPKIPWDYFPTWFLISTPLGWLGIAFTGILILIIDICRRPLSFVGNTVNRNFVLYLLSFAIPVAAVIGLHSVIYDDWRHLYFVYPPLILAGLFGAHKMLKSKFRPLMASVFIAQAAAIGYFMIGNHPFGQVYFNESVSHASEYLRKNYDFDYWGCSTKQALEHIAETDHRESIKIAWGANPVTNNILMLPQDIRKRFEMAPKKDGDYLVTNFRMHPDEYPYQKVFSIKVQNSSVVAIYKLR